MHRSAVPPPSHRPPDNELYDRGCDLVEAAASIRCLVGDPQAARAVPALLGCIEATLHELVGASALLEETGARSTDSGRVPLAGSRRAAQVERASRGLVNLRRALTDAADASNAVRSLTARSLAGRELDGNGVAARRSGLRSLERRAVENDC